MIEVSVHATEDVLASYMSLVTPVHGGWQSGSDKALEGAHGRPGPSTGAAFEGLDSCSS